MARRSTLLPLSLLVVLACGAARAQEPPAPEAAAPADAAPGVREAARPPGSPGADAPAAGAAAQAEPWRLARALELPTWLHVEGSHRIRYEYLQNQFRAGRPGEDMGTFFRTLLLLELRLDPVRIGAELQDSRAYWLGDDTLVTTGEVNTLELLQAYARFELDPLLPAEQHAYLRGGRFTLNLGSRRLVARSNFRNTSNAFTGVEGQWRHDAGWSANALVAMPIQRRPTAADDLEDNEVEFDREREDVLFWGLFLASPPLTWAELLSELYVFGLHEDDADEWPTADRELYTFGARLRRKDARGELDFELEAMLQLGSSRASTSASDTRDLDHLAYAVIARLGYTFDAPGSPRLVLGYDYVSGDRDPSDGRNGRFDTLFGARRGEYGPTGLFGPIPRANLSSPEVWLTVTPHEALRLTAAYRAFWLAERRDAWTSARVRDPSGDSGRFVGHFLEATLRWDALPGNLRVDLGVAALLRGELAREAPGANAGEPLFVHGSLGWTF